MSLENSNSSSFGISNICSGASTATTIAKTIVNTCQGKNNDINAKYLHNKKKQNEIELPQIKGLTREEVNYLYKIVNICITIIAIQIFQK